jgi:hypothetical protein
MSRSSIAVAVVVLALLAALALWGLFLRPQQTVEAGSGNDLAPNGVVPERMSLVCGMTISGQGPAKVFVRESDMCSEAGSSAGAEAPAGTAAERGWYVASEGVTYRARAKRVEEFLRTLRELKTIRSFPGSAEPKQSPRESPAAAVTLRLASSAQRTLYVGRQNQSLEAIHVQRDDTRRVFVVRDALSFYLTRPLPFWVSGGE